jgi:hypothetical protein
MVVPLGEVMGWAAENEMVVKRDPKVVAEVRRFVRLVAGQYGMDDFVAGGPGRLLRPAAHAAADASSETCRGLFIVDRYARCWGIRYLVGNAGKVVFAVIDRA